MLHHVSLGTNDVARAKRFYDPVLAVVGLTPGKVEDGSIGYGGPHFEYEFALEKPTNGEPASVGNGVHIAFALSHRGQVDEFHRVALANGGADAGAPGLRPHYDPNYYAAFVRDPDGNKIEAVTYAGA